MKHTYQDCIDHANDCRAKEEQHIKATLARNGLPEYYWADFVHLPVVCNLGSAEDEFYNYISFMDNIILDHTYMMCRVAEHNNTRTENQKLKRENEKLRNENRRLDYRVNSGEIYVIGGKIKLTRKKH